MKFEYYFTQTAMGQIDVEDIGNVTIHAFTDMAKQYLLTVSTDMGNTSIVEIGPLPFDISLPVELYPSKINCSYQQMDFSESKICSRIEKFLSNPLITQVEIVDFEDVKDNFINFGDLL